MKITVYWQETREYRAEVEVPILTTSDELIDALEALGPDDRELVSVDGPTITYLDRTLNSIGEVER